MHILGYQIREAIYQSANSLIYKASRVGQAQSVILKMIRQAYPSPQQIAQFEREYQMTRSLALTGVPEVFELGTDQHRWVMVIEDFGGESLSKLELKGKLPLEGFLELAIAIVQILAQIHACQIIHKDINPGNIVWNPTTKKLKIIDFGISTQLTREVIDFRNPEQLEGTLAYLSPEQTGRMNRAIDYRSDFYSLGVTFYELLTGQLPFSSHDPLELVHSHIARQPQPPHTLKPDLPLAISQIVLKLMHKNAEDRYQSAYGLQIDLQACLEQLQTSGQIHPLLLGKADISSQFQISHKLYGRQAEIATILTAFERVSQGSSELLLVTGYAGIGKSALVKEVYKPITQAHGYFIAGKFDQLQRDIPYASLVSAFRDLVRQLLSESQTQIEGWRQKLLQALGLNGQVIIEVIPEVEAIIGPQNSAPDLGATETQHRFNLVLQQFIQVFTQPEHPLVIFVDDLQWADSASLRLIEFLMTNLGSHHLLLIAAYRNNEVSGVHPLQVTLDQIHVAGASIQQILLSPLDLDDINLLITDTFNCPLDEAKSLSQLLLDKTAGNPFFINEFLKSLYLEELINFDVQLGRWRWDLQQIQTQDFTDNVVELLIRKVRGLEEKTQQILRLAACIGNQFELRTLATISQLPPHKAAKNLWTALQVGLLQPLGNGYKFQELEIEGLAEEITAEYKFAHDRIQQAAYALIPEAEKQVIHWQIGQLLRQNTPSDRLEKKIFDIVNQLNQGRSLALLPTQREELAQLNLIAGRKAKAAAAYQSAYNYLKIGIELLNQVGAERCWQHQYELTLALHLDAAEAAGLSGDLQDLDHWIDVTVEHEKDWTTLLRSHNIQIRAYISQQRPSLAAKAGLKVLRLLEVDLPEKPVPADLFRRLEKIKAIWIRHNIEDLIDLPEITDATRLATLSLLHTTMILGVFGGLPEDLYYPLLVLEIVNILLTYGNTPLASTIYVNYAVLLCGVTQEIEAGYQFGQLGLQILERFNARQHDAATVYVFNTFIRHWKEPLRTSLNSYLEVYNSGLETGDLFMACLALFMNILHGLWSGENLAVLHQRAIEHHETVLRLRHELQSRWLEYIQQLLLNFLDQTANPLSLTSENYDEVSKFAYYQEINDVQLINFININKVYSCYLFSDYQQALDYVEKAEKITIGAGLYSSVILNFYQSLSMLAIFLEAEESEQTKILNKVAANQQIMDRWAQYAPMNFLHKYYLVEAERVRVLRNDREALELYDQAIALAKENEYLNEEALAYELAAKFCLGRNQNHLAYYYLQDAYYAYQRWDAVAKVKDLENRYPQFFTPRLVPNQLIPQSAVTTATDSNELLDLNSVIKASQTISSEIVLENLLKQLMKTVLENAGAQKGFLILEKEGNWVIEAEGIVDSNDIHILQSIPIESADVDRQIPLLSVAIINYVAHTQESLVLNDAAHEGQFTRDPYIVATQAKSILCTPLLNQSKLSGFLYLENNLTTRAFTADRLEVLKLLSSQAAISLQNAQLYVALGENEKRLTQFLEAMPIAEVLKDSLTQKKGGRMQYSVPKKYKN